MAHLAIIVRSSYNAAESHFAWFCSLLQTSWATEKNAIIHSNRPLAFAPMEFLFWLYILIRRHCTVLGRQLSVSLTKNDKPIYAVKTDFVSQVYIIRTKIHEQNKNTVGAKTRSLWELIFVLFLLPKRFAVNWKTRRNATRHSLLQIH